MWTEHARGVEAGLETAGQAFDPGLPGLLCIHGSGGRGGEFLPMLERLGGAANGAALDLPGHGGSPGPGMDEVEAYASWVAGFLEKGPVRPVLLGNSLGGAIALSVALSRPELIKGLVLWGTGARLRVLPAILDGLANDFGPTVEMLVGLAYAPGTDEALKREGGRAMAQTEPRVLWGDYSACNRFDVMSRLDEIELPTLVVCGEQDKLTPVKYSQFLAARIKGARLAIIAEAGHLIHQEQPQAGAEAIAGFLKGL